MTPLRDRYDAIVIGGGLGGLLAAAQLAKRGKSVLLLDRQERLGGRPTSHNRDGVHLSTGALHLLPHGSRGPLAQMLRELEVPHTIVDVDAFASFHVGGKQVVCRQPQDVLQVFSLVERMQLAAMVASGKMTKSQPEQVSLKEWVSQFTRSQRVHACLDRFSQFALSIPAEQLTYNEGRRVLKAITEYGLPGVPKGGCLAVIDSLGERLHSQGVQVLLTANATCISTGAGSVDGVTFGAGEGQRTVACTAVVTDIGLEATQALLGHTDSNGATVSPPKATGLKLHFLSPKSLIPHFSVLFPLDTLRVAGVVQVTNADPSLAPPGQHLLMSHQVLQSDDVAAEKRLALEDLRHVFGEDFEQCEVVAASAFRRQWSVNRAIQGVDVPVTSHVNGLYLVGDGCRPAGMMMVEGVAESVREMIVAYGQRTPP